MLSTTFGRWGNVARMKGITMTTPSEREARIALCDRESGIADLGAHLLTVTGNRSLVITLADRGVMIFEIKDKPLDEEALSMPQHELKKMMWTEYLPTFARYTVDPMGAGDAMLATTACALAAGCSIMQATYLGNCGAAVECSMAVGPFVSRPCTGPAESPTGEPAERTVRMNLTF